MANYSLVIDSKFKPFSFQEMLAPALLAQQAHEKIEEQLSELSTKAGVWERLANETTDPKAYQTYKKYANDLKASADQLATHGLNPSSKRGLFDMRSRYASEITPIEEAYKRRQEDSKLWMETMLKDPTHMFRKNPSQTSLDYYIDNPNANILAENFSGALLTQQVAEQMKNMATELRSVDTKSLNSINKLLITKYGFSREQILNAINNPNDPNNEPIISAVINNVLGASGIPQWGDEDTLKKARWYANQGLYAGIGKDHVSPYTDAVAEAALKHKYAMEEASHAAALKEAAERKKASQGDFNPKRSWSFLENNGTHSAFESLRKKLYNKDGKLQVGAVTRHFVNPLKIYNDYQRVQQLGEGSYSPTLGRILYANGDIYEKEQRKFKNKYGNVNILTDAEYDALKRAGYTENSTFADFQQDVFSDRVRRTAAVYSHKSVNLNESALKERGQNLASFLQFAEDKGQSESKIWEMKEDGKVGKPLEVKSSDIIGQDTWGKGTLQDVYYSRQVPDKLHVVIDGKSFYVTPSAFANDVVSNIVKQTNQMLKYSDDTLVNYASQLGINGVTGEEVRNFLVEDATEKLRDAMRAYGQGVPNTNADLIK